MKIKGIAVGILASVLALAFSPAAWAAEPLPIQLPSPQMDGGKPLMQAPSILGRWQNKNIQKCLQHGTISTNHFSSPGNRLIIAS